MAAVASPTRMHPDTQKLMHVELALLIAEARIRALQARVDELEDGR